VEALQTWALLQYSAGAVGNEALFGAAGGSAPPNNGVSDAAGDLYQYEMVVQLDVRASACPDPEAGPTEVSDFGGASVSLRRPGGLYDSGPNGSGLYAKVWIDGKADIAKNVSDITDSGNPVTLLDVSFIDSRSHEFVVVLGDQSIDAMDYATAKLCGTSQDIPEAECDGGLPSMKYSILPIEDTRVVHYETPQDPRWKPIVDELAATDWTPDDSIEITEVIFDEANKVQSTIIKVGDQTCTYADGAYTVS
jgi:hypothetical protein